MTSKWPAEEVETLVNSYCKFIIGPDDTPIRRRLDRGMWKAVATDINNAHSGKDYHLHKEWNDCASKIELFRANFRKDKGACPKEIKALMQVFDAPQQDPLLNEGDVIVPIHEQQAHKVKGKKKGAAEIELERVALILTKVSKGEISAETAFYEIEGPWKVSLETFRKNCRSGGDAYGSPSQLAIREVMDDCRHSLSRLEDLKIQIAEQESHILWNEKEALLLLEVDDPICNFVKIFSSKTFGVHIKNNAASLIALRGSCSD